MKIYLETKNANAHRIVFCATNGKLTYEGEWCKRKATAYDTLWNHAYFFGYRESIYVLKATVIERKYKAKSFPKNAGPKKKK